MSQVLLVSFLSPAVATPVSSVFVPSGWRHGRFIKERRRRLTHLSLVNTGLNQVPHRVAYPRHHHRVTTQQHNKNQGEMNCCPCGSFLWRQTSKQAGREWGQRERERHPASTHTHTHTHTHTYTHTPSWNDLFIAFIQLKNVPHPPPSDGSAQQKTIIHRLPSCFFCAFFSCCLFTPQPRPIRRHHLFVGAFNFAVVHQMTERALWRPPKGDVRGNVRLDAVWRMATN